jgi:succinyl-diaminopimelate desuccinylase
VSDLPDKLARRTLELVRTESVYGDERALCDQVEAWAAARFSAERVRRVGNALVAGRPSKVRPAVALVGHLDTVPPHEGDPAPAIAGGRVIGVGASDMKAGLAVAFALADDLDLDRLPFELLIVAYDKEEGPHLDSGLAPLLAACPWLAEIDLAIVAEPTDNVIQVGCVGSIHATLTFRGKSAHSARPWHGENAIHKAGRVLSDLDARAPVCVEVGGHVFREVMSVTRAGGGRYRNVVPDRFELGLNYRFAPGRTPEQAKAEVRTLAGADAEVEFTDIAPSGQVPAGPIYDHLVAHAGVAVAPKQAWTDVARLAEAGIPAVNFGPGLTAQAHQPAEYCEIARLVEGYLTLRRVLETPPKTASP